MNVLGHQAGRVQVADPALHRLIHKVIRHPRLHLAGLHRGEDALFELHPPLRSRAVRQLALDHVVAQCPLSGVVGGRHQRVAQERPHRRPHLQQVRAGVGRALALMAQLQLNPYAPL